MVAPAVVVGPVIVLPVGPVLKIRNSPNLLASDKKQYNPFRMKFIQYRRCFIVRKSGSYMCKKSAKTGQAKNPRDIGS